MPHLCCFFDNAYFVIMDLSLCALVPEEGSCLGYATWCQVHLRYLIDDMGFAAL